MSRVHSGCNLGGDCKEWLDGGKIGLGEGVGVASGRVVGAGGAKVSCPMSSIMSESDEPIGLEVDPRRFRGGQGSPAMVASLLSVIS